MLLLDLFAAGLILLAIVQWTGTIRAYHGVRPRLVYDLVRMTVGTVKLLLLLSGLLGVASAFVALFAPDLLPNLGFGVQLASGLYALTWLSLPPTVLLLASSSPAYARLYNDLVSAVPPLRLAHLIYDFHFGAVQGHALRNLSLRTMPELDWRKVVLRLMVSVPLVVIDVREWSPHVRWECQQVFELGLQDKTVFLVESSSHADALLAIQSAAGYAIGPVCVVDASTGPALLKQLTRQMWSGTYHGVPMTAYIRSPS